MPGTSSGTCFVKQFTVALATVATSALLFASLPEITILGFNIIPLSATFCLSNASKTVPSTFEVTS